MSVEIFTGAWQIRAYLGMKEIEPFDEQENTVRTDDLDIMLNESDPAKNLTRDQRREASRLVSLTSPRRRIKLKTATLATLGLLLAAGGAATSYAVDRWLPWAQRDALAAVEFMLPSGTNCEVRIGDLTGAPAGAHEALQEAFINFELTPHRVMRAAEQIGLPPTPTDDEEYGRLVRQALFEHIEHTLVAHGFEKPRQLSLQGFCS